MTKNTYALVATLGGQPQIVTFTLDLLLQAGYHIDEVIVVHPNPASQPRIQYALSQLHAEFTGDYYQAGQCQIHFHSQVLELDNQPIDDIIDSSSQPHGMLDTIHRLLGDLKRQGHHIHLSVSGGRRMMALLAISVAIPNFGRYDHLWHIYTPNHIKEFANEGQTMHMPKDAGIRLIEVPFIPMGAYIYPPTRPFNRAQEEQRLQVETLEHTRCAQVVERATQAQLKVLRAYARGLSPRQVADELQISLPTVNSHSTFLYSLCRETWNIPKNTGLNYMFLQTKFANYFQDGQQSSNTDSLRV
jgi:CRISPR-associated protein Csx14